jgi:hippurate hydrolase
MTLLDDARALTGQLTDLRHRLHRHPELGLDLPRTQQSVLDELAPLGLEVSTGTTCTSVTAVLRGTGAPTGDTPRPVVLLRGDMDALPVTEALDVPFRSELDGVMHACGHDLHTAMLVGAARLLGGRREALTGDVVFMFQPGEEGHDGAGRMIAEGVLDAAGRRADAAFALHVMSNLTARGCVATRPGPLMAASDGLFVTVRGAGGHGSAPHGARDPVPAACEMVLALQTAMTRRIDPFTPAVLTVGTIHGGTRRNIIPDSVSFEATVRTFDPAVQAVIAQAAREVCTGVAAAHGVQVDVRYEAEYPVTVNDADETRFALDVVRGLFGPQAALPMPNPITGSEDFSRVIAQVPGAMLFLGALTDDREPASAPGNHSPLAAFDDRVLPLGAALYAELAAQRLARR